MRETQLVERLVKINQLWMDIALWYNKWIGLDLLVGVGIEHATLLII